jgi:hypothetical protein
VVAQLSESERVQALTDSASLCGKAAVALAAPRTFSEAERVQGFADLVSLAKEAADALAELRTFVESPGGTADLLEDPDFLSDVRATTEEVMAGLEFVRGHLAGTLGPRLPLLHARCARCHVVVTDITPSPAFALHHEPIRYLVPRRGHDGTRWLDASPAGSSNVRVRLVCPRKRCGRTVTISMRLLVERFIAAVSAGRSDLELT